MQAMLQMRVDDAESTHSVGIPNTGNVSSRRSKPQPEALDAVLGNQIELRTTIRESPDGLRAVACGCK